MVKFVDKYGYYLHISMVNHETDEDFTNEFFITSALKKDADGCYIVTDVDYLIMQAEDCWSNRGDYSDGSPNYFSLLYTSYLHDHKTVRKMLDSDYLAKRADDYNVPYECCI